MHARPWKRLSVPLAYSIFILCHTWPDGGHRLSIGANPIAMAAYYKVFENLADVESGCPRPEVAPEVAPAVVETIPMHCIGRRSLVHFRRPEDARF
jgi:hypothetical protein